MTSTTDFLDDLERDLLSKRAPSSATCTAFATQGPETRSAYAHAMRFLGCASAELPPVSVPPVPEADRVCASRLMLLKLQLNTGEPAWSSWMLERLLEAVVATPGGRVGDLFRALHAALREYHCELTTTVGNLIKTLVVTSFALHRHSFEAAPWDWIVQETSRGTTPAQAYLALLITPPTATAPLFADTILQSLAHTPYFQEARNCLCDDSLDAANSRQEVTVHRDPLNGIKK